MHYINPAVGSSFFGIVDMDDYLPLLYHGFIEAQQTDILYGKNTVLPTACLTEAWQSSS